MKRFIAVILASAVLLSGCALQTASTPGSTSPSIIESTDKIPTSKTSESKIDEPRSSTAPKAGGPTVTAAPANIPEFNDLGDPKLLQYIEDSVYAGLVDQFSGEDFKIENVSAIYYSKEYLEELDYNSKANIFFGYTLKELDEQFHGTRYVFTLNDKSETTVQPFEDYDDTIDQVIKYVAIGAGVILVGVILYKNPDFAREVGRVILFASVNALAAGASSSVTLSGVAMGANAGIQTKDSDQVIQAAALNLGKIIMEVAIKSQFDKGY